MQASFLMTWAIDSLDPGQYGYTHNTRESGFVEVAQTSQNVLTTDATLGFMNSLSGPEAVEGGFNPNAFNIEATSMLDQIHASSFMGTAQPSRSGSALSARDWNSLMNWSPSPAQSVVAIAERSSDRLSLPQDTIPSSATDVMPFVTDNQSEGGSFGTVHCVRITNDKPVTCAGFDTSSASLPLLLLKAHLEQDLLSDAFLKYYSRGSDLAKLLDTVQSEWLRFELDNVICWIFETLSKNIRQHQAGKRIGNSASPFEESREPSAHRRRSVDRFETNDEIQIVEKSYARSRSHKGILQVTQGNFRDRGTLANAPEALTVSFMPKDRRRATGLHVALFNVMSEIRGPRISPRLRTFNVIPDHSKIISCIKRNDLNGLQALFDKREASPTDVDSRGFSLLSVSVYLENSRSQRLTDSSVCNVSWKL